MEEEQQQEVFENFQDYASVVSALPLTEQELEQVAVE
jgi:hypothetical protein